MSFDLGFWYEPDKISPEQAARRYAAMIESAEGVAVKKPELADFLGEVLETYPDLTPANVETSPWSMSPYRTDEYVIVSMAFSRQREVKEFLLRLAGKYGMTCFDPQAAEVYRPARGPRWTLQQANGTVRIDPEPSDVLSALRSIAADNWYVTLEREPQVYIQVGYGVPAGVPDGSFAVETRDGGPDRHYRAVVHDLDRVSDAFRGFLSGDRSWPTGLEFVRIGVG